ncbi:MAG: c-type cytochrome [Burkholderiales bacterium]|nr:c-type cytochrome [Burkholderiales bacterium]
MNRIARLTFAVLVVSAAGTASAFDQGRELYSHFRCSGCHGDGGRGSATEPRAKNIAGMPSAAVLSALRAMVARGGHEETYGGSCADSPTPAQMRAIADYVERLPRAALSDASSRRP